MPDKFCMNLLLPRNKVSLSMLIFYQNDGISVKNI